MRSKILKKIMKISILSVAVFATLATSLAPSLAHGHGDRWGRPPPPHIHDYGPRHHNRGNAVAAGIVGLATGAIIGSALSQPSRPQVIYQAPPPPPVAYQPAAPQYYAPAPRPVYQPWTQGWYQYCANQYRSFNPRTGTFRGYDGQDHFCNAN